MESPEEHGNMAPGQEHAPEQGKTQYNPDELPAEKINEGARDESQLEQFKQNAAESDDSPQRAAPKG